MNNLPIRKVALYQHGLGWFRREGQVSARELTLSFPRRAMDDVLKSLVVIDRVGSGVEGLSFETPADRNPAMHRPPLAIDPAGALLGVLTAFRGRRVRLTLAEGRELAGELLGVEHQPGQPLACGRAALLGAGGALHFPTLGELAAIVLDDSTARADLDLLLRSARSDEEREQTTLRLGPGEHELELSYLAPAPAWRVSYRLLIEPTESGTPADPAAVRVLLQGWALFENTLDEDLEAVELSLLAGEPVSFRYPLHAPRTPERPLLDDRRPDIEPMVEADPIAPAAPAAMMVCEASVSYAAKRMDLGEVADSARPVAEGSEQGVLFAYTIATLVSVGRGQSAMVPLLNHLAEGRRLLHYLADDDQRHPQAMVEVQNGAQTLERGPVTVIDDGGYGGEGLLEYCPAGARLRLRYARELGIRVEEDQQERSERHRLQIAQGGLIRQTHELRERSFSLHSQLPRAAVVEVEFPCWSHDSCFVAAPGVVEPDRIESGVARLDVLVPAGASPLVRTRERRLLSQRFDSEQLAPGLLRRLIDEAEMGADLRTRLDAVLRRADRIQALQQQKTALQQQRNGLYQRQQQLRENLAPLAAQGSEGELRARLVGDLGRAQDELDALERQDADLGRQISALREEQREALRG